MINSIEIYFLLFLIYSFIGWGMEVIADLIRTKKFVNRGFLIGPCCPIYGVGVILITFLLERYKTDTVITFVLTILLCGTLEYITSYLMEKLFNARWWDYSNHKFNINGRISLAILLFFGIGGCFVIYVLNPIMLNYLCLIPGFVLNIISIIALIAIIIDTIVSFEIILDFKSATVQFKDSTEEISRKVKEIISQKSAAGKRLIDAFPDLEMIKTTIKNKIQEGKEAMKK
ncbi:MAG: hypothetical protein K0R72_1044 [Clostridia bacterium]|jgi:uncharacterized membrane protein|nr:hypothetical protein [Clostridia bacterium]